MQDSTISNDLGKLVLRLTVGGLMLLHGFHKAMNPESLDFIKGTLEAAELPTFLSYGVYVGEILAPLLIIVGLFSRIGGMLLVVNMIFAVGLVHVAQLGLLTPQGGWQLELQAFYFFGALAIFFLGSGRIALKAD
tara:strand:- start:1336 stop:1740 length:405 start_codon:yes stop_codon:yes gene_type:complete